MKTVDTKNKVIERLRKIPIVEIVCEQCAIGKTTFYRWKAEDSDFAKEVDEALQEGAEHVSDMAESQLLTAIQNGNMTGIMFWLKNRSPHYRTKVDVSGEIRHTQALTPDQKAAVEKAFRLAHLSVSNEEPHGKQDAK
jgi:hypothetical protein